MKCDVFFDENGSPLPEGAEESAELRESDPAAEPAEAEDEAEDEEPKVGAVEYFEDALKLYMCEIQKTKLLTAAEETQLANRIAEGDKEARDRMVVANLRLVVNI